MYLKYKVYIQKLLKQFYLIIIINKPKLFFVENLLKYIQDKIFFFLFFINYFFYKQLEKHFDIALCKKIGLHIFNICGVISFFYIYKI